MNAGYTSTFAGTSASAPHAAGVAAILLAVEPGLTRLQVIDRMEAAARKDLLPANFNSYGWSPSFGYGQVQAYNTLGNIVTSPLPLFGLSGLLGLLLSLSFMVWIFRKQV